MDHDTKPGRRKGWRKPNPRDRELKIGLTADERATVEEAAAARRETLSEFARRAMMERAAREERTG